VRENEEEADVREDGNNKNIDEENTVGKGEGFDERATGADS
jgi:hypothetical protein